ncbi:MAG: PLP-dependent aminotransferase family protein [Fusicatenibacter sp.]
MNELTISLDSHSKIPLYEQIYGFIREEIRKREILPGERLPSSRTLSSYLSVSRSTVDLAYEQLVSEGYVESIPCRGYFVCEIEELYRLGETQEERKTKTGEDAPKYRYQFAVSGITPDGFPHNAWKKISREVLLDASDDLFRLGDPRGERGLREAIAAYLHHARGVNCRPDQIIVGAGNDYLLMLLSVVLGRGADSRHVVAMENPTYMSAYRCFVNLGFDMRSISMDDSGMQVGELEESGADLAYVMPSHQFPMGMVMPMKRRMQLLSWAAKEEKRYLIEDDYDSEFRYKGRPIPALQGYDTKGKVIYLGTFSRAIAPSIRISYMVLPERLWPLFEQRGINFSATVSKTDQKIIEIFMREGYFERHLNRMRAIYKGKHDLMMKCLKGMSKICTVSGENAGVHVLLHFVNGLTEEEAILRARKAGIRVYGLGQYYTEEPERQDSGAGADAGRKQEAVLLGYATMTEQQILEAMEILKKVWICC